MSSLLDALLLKEPLKALPDGGPAHNSLGHQSELATAVEDALLMAL